MEIPKNARMRSPQRNATIAVTSTVVAVIRPLGAARPPDGRRRKRGRWPWLRWGPRWRSGSPGYSGRMSSPRPAPRRLKAPPRHARRSVREGSLATVRHGRCDTDRESGRRRGKSAQRLRVGVGTRRAEAAGREGGGVTESAVARHDHMVRAEMRQAERVRSTRDAPADFMETPCPQFPGVRRPCRPTRPRTPWLRWSGPMPG